MAGTRRFALPFLDPPYGHDRVPRAIARLREVGRIAPDALLAAETGHDKTSVPDAPLLVERRHGAAQKLIFDADLSLALKSKASSVT